MKKRIILTETELKNVIKDVLNENLFGGSDTRYVFNGKDISDKIKSRPKCSPKFIQNADDKKKFFFTALIDGNTMHFNPSDVFQTLNGDWEIRLEEM